MSTARIPGSVRLFSFKEKGAAPHRGYEPNVVGVGRHFRDGPAAAP